jgi:spore coat polysaccharide biosynthesis protein SpsF (cytidylyltransferase family)/spore coat polysaccharide biosynthesis predicted glycosyltransferase SpsG
VNARVLGVVGARLNSSRLPKKQLLELAGRPIIEHIFARLALVADLDKIVLATTADDYNQPLVDWAKAHDRDVFAFDGDVNDLVGRVDALVRREDADIVVYFCGDSPLIEPATVDRLLQAFADHAEADLVRLRPPASGRFIHEGFSVFRRRVWDRIVAEGRSAAEKEHVGSALKRFESELNSIEVEEPPIYSSVDHRISVDTPSDYRFMAEVYRRWYADHAPDSIVSLQWVIGQLQADAALAAINAEVRQKSVGETSPGVLIVCQVGPAVGLGHLSRALCIARSLQDHLAAGVRLLVQGEVPPGHRELQLLPHRAVDEGGDLGAAILEDAATGVRAVIFDLHPQRIPRDTAQLVAALKAKGIRSIGIDSALAFSEGLDLVVVPAIYVAAEALAQCRAPVRHGWDWLLLAKSGAPRPWQRGANVLVTIGGSDVTGLGQSLPTQMDGLLPLGCCVNWVQGPFAKKPVLPAKPRLEWTIHEAPAGLDALIGTAHFGLAAFGVSVFELLHSGIPTVVFSPYGGRDHGSLECLRRDEVAAVATDGAAAAGLLASLQADEARARQLSANASGRVDGHGGRRLAAELGRLLGSTN